MPTKTTPKSRRQPQEAARPSRQDVQLAYQVHTLASMLYGQLAATHPWIVSQPALGQPTLHQATSGWDAQAGYPTAFPTGPAAWGPLTWSH